MNSANLLSNNEFVYLKPLGWKEYTEDGHATYAIICVIECRIGFNVFRMGEYCEHLDWFNNREYAIEYAVDQARREIAEHEVRQAERD